MSNLATLASAIIPQTVPLANFLEVGKHNVTGKPLNFLHTSLLSNCNLLVKYVGGRLPDLDFGDLGF